MGLDGPEQERKKKNQPGSGPEKKKRTFEELGNGEIREIRSADEIIRKARQQRRAHAPTPKKTIPTGTEEGSPSLHTPATLPTFPKDNLYVVPAGLTADKRPVTLFGIARSFRDSLPKTKEQYLKIPKEERYLSWEQVDELRDTPALFLARALDRRLIAQRKMPAHTGLEPKPPAAGTKIDLKSFFTSLSVSEIQQIQTSEGTQGGRLIPSPTTGLPAKSVWALAQRSANRVLQESGAVLAKTSNSKPHSLRTLPNTAQTTFYLSYIESNWDPKALSSVGASGLLQLRDIAIQDLGLKQSDWRTSPETNMYAGTKLLTKLFNRFRHRTDDPFTDRLLNSSDKAVLELRKHYTKEEIRTLCQTEKGLFHALAAYNIGPTLWSDVSKLSSPRQEKICAAAARYIAKFLTARRTIELPSNSPMVS